MEFSPISAGKAGPIVDGAPLTLQKAIISAALTFCKEVPIRHERSLLSTASPTPASFRNFDTHGGFDMSPIAESIILENRGKSSSFPALLRGASRKNGIDRIPPR